MEDKQTGQVPVGSLVPRAGNRKEGGFGDLAGLAESIAEKGVLQALIVRTANDAGPIPDGAYEIVAGERRWRAAQLAGLEAVPCRVVEVDDREADAISATENLQREDLTPMDEAFEIVRLLKAWESPLAGSGLPVEEVAAKIGRGATYVRQRASLVNLTKKARKKLRNEEGKLSLSYALVLARYPAHVQDEVVDPRNGNAWMLERGIRGLQDQIAQRFMMDLAQAPFGKDDASLVPKAGTCLVCPKRSREDPGLFPELGSKGDRCLDHVCFGAKLDANLKVVLATAKKEGAELLQVATEYSYIPKGSLDPGEWRRAGKGDKDSVPAVVVTGAERGKVLLVIKGRSSPDGGGPVEKGSKMSEAQKAARRKKIEDNKVHSLTVDRLYKEMAAAVAKRATIRLGDLLPVMRVVARRLIDRTDFRLVEKVLEPLGWKAYKPQYGMPEYRSGAEEGLAKMGSEELVLLMAQLVASEALGPYKIDTWLERMAVAVGLEPKKVEAEVRAKVVEARKEREARKTATAKNKGTSRAPRGARGTCQVCGCTDKKPCEGGCSWTNKTHTLCSSCEAKKRRGSGRKAKPAAKGKKAVGRKARG